MAPSQSLAIPSKDPLPHSLRLPTTHPSILKTLSRLSRPSLLQLATDWCSSKHQSTCGPYLNDDYEPDDPDVLWTAANTIEELTELYRDELSTRKGAKRELLDRILEGDWRHGISLQQMAMAECQILVDHPTSIMWTAFQLTRHRDPDFQSKNANEDAQIPRLHAPSFILALHQQIGALTRAHYYVTRPGSFPITLIRVALFDTPYAHSDTILTPELISASKSVLFAFPDGAPFVYVSLPTVQATKDVDAESRSLQSFVVKAIPTAISRPLERYELKPTQLTARSLDTLLAMRGSRREGGIGGGWSTYADENAQSNALDVSKKQDTTALDAEPQEEKLAAATASKEQIERVRKRTFDHSDPTGHLPAQKRKRLKELASGRFGKVGTSTDKKALSRFDVKIEDAVNGNPRWKPSVKISFQGAHIFAGLRKLVEAGVIDTRKMPGWMTGETNTSVGTVKDGRMNRWDDSGE
jgi:central kinetochore subunit Mis15/CHL4